MKIRSSFLAILLALAAVALAGPVASQAKVPGIKTTSEYRSLNNFVNTLKSKRNTPATATRKDSYRAKLTARRSAANNKVKLLFNRRVLVISKKDDARQRRAIRQIRSGQKLDVANLNSRLAEKLNILRTKQAAAIDRVTAPYTVKINKLTNKRSILKKRLRKTGNPEIRDRIRNRIELVQKQINALAARSQDAANAAAGRYNGRIAAVSGLYATKIANVKARAARDIQQANNAYKRLFKDQVDTAKEIRTNDFQLVTSLRDRGAGYILEMPLAL